MNTSIEFALGFAKLTSVLATRPDAVDEQKDALRVAVGSARGARQLLAVQELSFAVAAHATSQDAARLGELVSRLSAHSVRDIEIAADVTPAELLALARAIADEAAINDDGFAFDSRLTRIDSAAFRVKLGRAGFMRSTTPTSTATATYTAAPARSPTVHRAMPAYGSTPSRSIHAQRATPAQANPTISRATPGKASPSIARATPAHVPMVAERPTSTPGSTIRDEQSGMIELAISNLHKLATSEEELFRELRAGVSPKMATRLLDELATFAEASSLRGEPDALSRVMHGLLQLESTSTESEARRAYGLTIRRLTKPSLLKAICQLLPRRPEQREELTAILVRTGADAAEVLIDLVTDAESASDRRAYLAALAKCRAGVPTLIHLLGDQRWFVVRNAADLLGEMQAVEAEARLLDAAAHPDERVRRSVVSALGRLGTPRALRGATQLLSDPMSQVRQQAAACLAGRRGAYSAAVLCRALDEEQDPEVQAAILSSLGRIATSDAVLRLIKAAQPTAGFFTLKRKSTAYRAAAVQALGDADTPPAREALVALASDKDRLIKHLASRLSANRSAAEDI